MLCEEKLRQRLLWRIGRNYQTVTQMVELSSLRFEFTRIADPDLVLDQVAAEVDLQQRLHGRAVAQERMHLPYWAELWDSAMGIAGYLVKEGTIREENPGARSQKPEEIQHVGSASADVAAVSSIQHSALSIQHSSQSSVLSPQSSPPSVLDLGCGMGLAGTVAAALGARVLFADVEPPALLFARLNSLPWQANVRTRQFDWQRDRLDERFDLILGADILYEKAQWPFLERFWCACLSSTGQVLLGEPGRATGEQFVPWIIDRGWNLEHHEQSVTTRPKPIRLFSLRRTDLQ